MSDKTQKIPWLLNNTVNSYDPTLARVILPWALKHPRYLRSFIRLRKTYKRAEQTRKLEFEGGVKVPPFLILSMTSKCNLKCSGCYANAAGNVNSKTSEQLNMMDWDNIIKDASELGVFCFILAGGEPFLFPGLLELCDKFRNNFFLILTNGTVLKDNDFKKLKKMSNVGIIVSLEGGLGLTDARRGAGVYKKAMDTLERLNKDGVITGISVTLTRINYNYWLEPKLLDDLINQGVRIGVFIEYIPTTPADLKNPSCPSQFFTSCTLTLNQIKNIYQTLGDNDQALILLPEERERFREYILNNRKTKSIYLVHSPGDEKYFGGCVSAGRGFAHVTPRGDLTPCPVSNIATHNLVDNSLRDALASPLFKEIRKNEHLLETEGLPCALFAHPQEVDELARSVGAYKTNIQ